MAEELPPILQPIGKRSAKAILGFDPPEVGDVRVEQCIPRNVEGEMRTYYRVYTAVERTEEEKKNYVPEAYVYFAMDSEHETREAADARAAELKGPAPKAGRR